MKKTSPQLLIEFISGLNEAIGAAGVMIHHQHNLRWHFVRKILEEVRGKIEKIAVNPLTAPKVRMLK